MKLPDACHNWFPTVYNAAEPSWLIVHVLLNIKDQYSCIEFDRDWQTQRHTIVDFPIKEHT